MTDAPPQNLLADEDQQTSAPSGGCGGHCTCGDRADNAPELDTRLIPPAIRHAAIFGALGAVLPGDSMVLVAPHEPVPLLQQLAQAQPGQWTTVSSPSGPDEWRVRLTRTY